MIEIEHVETCGWTAAFRGMRNPMNSWDRSDSRWSLDEDGCLFFEAGGNDGDLAMRLCKAGTEHRKFMRMITVSMDITAPLYWWKEFDTYKVGTTDNSCSTMHKLHSRDLTVEDFSREHLFHGDGTSDDSYDVLVYAINVINHYRKEYELSGDKEAWWQMIQLLPSSYNQRRTVHLNYEVLAGMYRQRRNHKLDEWVEFCKVIEKLPYSELITLKEN